jgi:hypothetical protein
LELVERRRESSSHARQDGGGGGGGGGEGGGGPSPQGQGKGGPGGGGLAGRGGAEEDVGSRLTREAAGRAERLVAQRERHEQALARAHSFAPTLSEGTARLAENHPKLRCGFMERQELLKAEEAAEGLRRKRAEAEAERALYKPDIGKSQSSVPPKVISSLFLSILPCVSSMRSLSCWFARVQNLTMEALLTPPCRV